MKIDIFNTDKKYNIIYADPPWSYNDKMHGHSFSLEHEYQTMPLKWIKELPIKNICEKDCILFFVGGFSATSRSNRNYGKLGVQVQDGCFLLV